MDSICVVAPGWVNQRAEAFIYFLCEPSGEVRYVGQTTNVFARSVEHLWLRPAAHNADVRAWIRNLKANGERPVFRVVVDCERDDADLLEAHFIHEYLSDSLLNRHIPPKPVPRWSVAPATPEDWAIIDEILEDHDVSGTSAQRR